MQVWRNSLAKMFGGLQTLLVIKPETNPVLQIFGRSILALWRKPGDLEIGFVGRKKRCAPATAKSGQYARFGAF